MNGPLPAASGGQRRREKVSAGSYCDGKQGIEWKRMGRTHIKTEENMGRGGREKRHPTTSEMAHMEGLKHLPLRGTSVRGRITALIH